MAKYFLSFHLEVSNCWRHMRILEIVRHRRCQHTLLPFIFIALCVCLSVYIEMKNSRRKNRTVEHAVCCTLKFAVRLC